MNKDIFANFITDHFNYCIAYGECTDELKHADVISVHKKKKRKNQKYDNINKKTSQHSEQHFQNL